MKEKGDEYEGKPDIEYSHYMLIQCAMLVFHFGLGWSMPWIAVWFPTLVVISLLAAGLLIFFVAWLMM